MTASSLRQAAPTVNGFGGCASLLTAQSSINATGNYNLTQSGTSDYALNLFNGGGGYVAKFGCAGSTSSAVGMFVSYGNYAGAQMEGMDGVGNFQYQRRLPAARRR